MSLTTPDERARRYGLFPGQLQDLQAACEDRCWVCGQPESVPGRSLAVDHDHRTGQVRGLLCTRCNMVIGRMQEDPATLRAMADYLDHSWDVFLDYCRGCPEVRGSRENAYRPTKIVETDGDRTRFGYECRRGHTWGCNWATRGMITVMQPGWQET